MSWPDIVLIALVVVDCSALAVGLLVLRRVTRLVKDAGEQIHAAVLSSIDDAERQLLREVTALLTPVLSSVGELVVRAVDQIGPEVRDAIKAVVQKEDRHD